MTYHINQQVKGGIVKSLIIIWLALITVVVGGTIFVNAQINADVRRLKQQLAEPAPSLQPASDYPLQNPNANMQPTTKIQLQGGY